MLPVMTSNRPSPARAGTLITVAPTGAESDKASVPALPVTLDELTTTAVECRAAGAAVIHVHIRDRQGQPTLDLSRLKDTVQALREGTDLIIQLSTGGGVTHSFGDRPPVPQAGAGPPPPPRRPRHLCGEGLRHPPAVHPAPVPPPPPA